MRHIPLSSRTSSLVCLLCTVLLGVSACDDRNPVGPTPPGPGQPIAQSIAITGSATLQRPGDAVQLTATATFSDGTTRNVSSEAIWSADSDIASVNRGLLTARGYGQCDVTVSYGQLQARAPVRVMPEGMFMLSGRVTDETGLPLWPAWVSVTPSDVEAKAPTNRQGWYRLPARIEVEVRAEMEGFESQTRSLTMSGDTSLDFQLRIRPGGFGGLYRLTFTAAASCDLPADAKQRTYLVRVAEGPSDRVTVVVISPDMVAMGEPGFTGTRDGARLQFSITHDYSADYHFVELLDPERELALVGTATGEVGDVFSTVFSGTAIVRQRAGAVLLAQCQAGDHRLEFTR